MLRPWFPHHFLPLRSAGERRFGGANGEWSPWEGALPQRIGFVHATFCLPMLGWTSTNMLGARPWVPPRFEYNVCFSLSGQQTWLRMDLQEYDILMVTYLCLNWTSWLSHNCRCFSPYYNSWRARRCEASAVRSAWVGVPSFVWGNTDSSDLWSCHLAVHNERALKSQMMWW